MLVNLTIYWFTSESLVMRKVKKQSGFTLVEIAIVLVIIGLLLGGVLKGQELIESSKIKSMANDLKSISSAVASYQERYRAVPGEDSTTANTTYNARGWTGTFAGTVTKDSLIGDGTAGAIFTTPGVENLLAVQALRAGGFITGDSTKAALPTNAAGGAFNLGHSVFGFVGQNVVCYSGLSGKQAGALDRQLDDGFSHSGLIRSAIETIPADEVAAANSIPYAEDKSGFVLCKVL